MTQEDQHAEIGKMFLSLNESRKQLGCLQSKAERMENDLRVMAQIVRDGVTGSPNRTDPPRCLSNPYRHHSIVGRTI